MQCCPCASDTTWLREIMDMIYHDGNVEKCRRDAIYNCVPFLEMKVSKGLSGELPQPGCLAWVEREQSMGERVLGC